MNYKIKYLSLNNVIELIKSRCRLVNDIPNAVAYFFSAPETYEEAGAKKYFKDENTAMLLDELAVRFDALDEFTVQAAEESIHSDNH